MTPDLVWLTALAAEVLGLSTEDALGAIDLESMDAVRAAVADAGDDSFAQAAALLVETVRARPLSHRNRRLAVLGVTWLLADGGLDLSFADGQVLGKLCAAVERHDADVDDVRQVLFDDVVHRDREGVPMFERFTKRARSALDHARSEARPLGHDFIGTEHLVLGLLRERDGVAAIALDGLGVSYDAFLESIRRRIGGPPTSAARPAFTPRAKKVLELSLREALKLGHNYIGTEHILLGVTAEGEGLAMAVLEEDFGTTGPAIRDEVIRVLTTPKPPGPTDRPSPEQVEEMVARYRADVSDAPELSDDEEVAMAEVVQAGIRARVDDDRRIAAEQAVESLVRAHLRGVVAIVLQVPGGGDVLGQIQQGNLALMAAAREWQPPLDGPFRSFVDQRVRAALAPAIVDAPPRRRRSAARFGQAASPRCTFCGKPQRSVAKLIAGPGVYICDECVTLCNDIIADDATGEAEEDSAIVRCAACGGDPLATAKVVSASVDGDEVRLLACGCGRVFGSA